MGKGTRMNLLWHNCFLTYIVMLVVFEISRVTHAELVLQPPQLSIGDQYRLAFTTSSTTDGMSSDIQYYNDFVQAAADASQPIAALGQIWTAIGSTADVDARTNTKTAPTADGVGVPVFLVDGSKIADNYIDLWDGSLDTPLDRTEIDTVPPISVTFIPTEGVWTGTRPDSGLKHELFFLGYDSSNPIWGGDSLTGAWSHADPSWSIATPQVNRAQFPLYALSGIITVVPEASSLRLALFCLFALLNCRRALPKQLVRRRASWQPDAIETYHEDDKLIHSSHN